MVARASRRLAGQGPGSAVSWAKLDDNLPNNPKIVGLTPTARWLFICGICYSARNLTDGALTGRTVKVLLAEASASKKHVEELFAAGLWDRAGDGFLIHDYLEYNPRKDEVLEERAKAKERMRRLRSSGERSGEQTGERAAGRSGVRSGTPSRPVSKDLKALGEQGLFQLPNRRERLQ